MVDASQPGSNNKAERKGPQGTQMFSRDELDRRIAESVTESGARPAVALRGASESVAGRVIALEGKSLLIGRAAHCDLVLNELSVSSEHARMTRDTDGWRIANLLSTNGTFVNGARATRAPLRNGDHVRVGRIDFVFEAPEAQRQAPAAGRRTRLMAGLLLLLAVAAAGVWLLAP